MSEIRNAIEAAMTAPPQLVFSRFDRGATHTQGGTVLSQPWSTWVSDRLAAASQRWPSERELVEDFCRADAELSGKELDETKKSAVKAAKTALPVEVGASLTDGQRVEEAVELISWLFVDVDDDADVASVYQLRQLLNGVNHLIIESPTSRLPDLEKGLRIHCYIQLRQLIIPATASVSRSDAKDWFKSLYAVAASALTSAVGLNYDSSVDDLSQPCFVSHVPPGCDKRHAYYVVDGQALDLERFAVALGHNIKRPGAQFPEDVTPRRRAAAPAATVAPAVESVAQPQPKSGPTPNETVGSLMMRAAEYFGWIADRNGNRLCLDRPGGKWAIRCPWAHNHKSDPRQALGGLDSSTVIYDNVTTHGEDGGFTCKHHGSGNPGECNRATAADVLSLARRRGCPLPDRPGWGSEVATVADEEPVAPATSTPRRDGRPTIVVRISDVAGMRDAAIAALCGRGDIFVRDAQLVDLTPSGPRPIPSDHLTAVLGEAARWVSRSRTEEGGVVEKPAKVPREVVGAVLKAPTWPGIRELRAVVKHPPLLPDGRLIETPGYDAESRLLYLPDDVALPVPARPTREDAAAAKDRLLAYVRNTAFCDERGPSVWLAFLLTLAARSSVPTAPIFAFDAAQAASGKTSLVKIAHGLVYGELPQLGAPVVDDDAEAEKRLPTWARTPLVVWDNVKHTFGSPVVDGAITAGKATVRRLGANESLSVDLTSTTWAMTGNNLSVGDDAASRCLVARIQAPTTRRYDFAVDDVAFYKAQRPRAVADALTILRAFIVAGSPQREDVPYCRFVEWSRLIRQALLWLGMPDPVGGEIIDSAQETRATALRAICEWRCGLLADEEREVLSAEEAASLPFFSSHLDTGFLKSRDESDEVFRRRRAVTDALSAIYGRRVEGSVKVGLAFGKLRDARVPLSDGRVMRFALEKEGAKTCYRVVFEG